VLFCLISGVGAEGAVTATAMIKKCPGAPEIAVSDNTCLDMLDTVLTGAEGGDATQNACVRAGPGVYKVETAAGGAGEFPFLTADAEE
jgi:hypothetical protein